MKVIINTDAAVIFTNKLEQLHRSGLPSAIRGTLNKLALHTKKETLLSSAKTTFKKRHSGNFWKAFSKVDFATGFNLKTMAATVGFTEQGLKGDNNYAVKDLLQQEEGGVISGRSYIPLEKSRSGNNKPVRKMNMISNIRKKGIVLSRDAKAVNKHQEFIKSAIHAGVGGFVLAQSGVGKTGALWKIKSITRKNSGTVFKKEVLYSFKKSGKAKVKATGFAKRAAEESIKEVEQFYIEEAERQIKRLTSK